MNTYQRKLPIGAEVLSDSGTHFRVWAPKCQKVAVAIFQDTTSSDFRSFDLENENNGYFSGAINEAREGMYYKFLLDKEKLFPDPASFFQPSGPLGHSQIIDHDTYHWNCSMPEKLPTRKVLYEMHLGTFTIEGTFNSACNGLKELSRLGITLIELMPIAEFWGTFGWGYDGVQQFAPYHHYGIPDDFKHFIDCAHQHGIAVVLDIVYNHLGREGLYFEHFSSHYFSTKYKNEWGRAINFDDGECKPVREYFITNALFWVDEYRVDGFRFDATQQIFDSSKTYLVKEITETIHAAFPEKDLFFIAENEPQDSGLLSNCGIDALWNDDFHRSSTIAMTHHKEAYFSDYRGTPQELISCVKHSFLYQGQYYSWQDKNRGSSTKEFDATRFIHYLQNHDQVANSCRGVRIHELTSLSVLRIFTGLLLLSPQIPLLFQGQEFASPTPFFYFADHPERAENLVRGRASFLSQFPSIRDAHGPLAPEPYSEKSFQQSKIDNTFMHDNPVYRLHKDLLELRHNDPVFEEKGFMSVDGAILDNSIFCIRYFGNEKIFDRLILVNIGVDTLFSSIPEPLTVPPEGFTWALAWYSENPSYGGNGSGEIIKDNRFFYVSGNTAYYFKLKILETV